VQATDGGGTLGLAEAGDVVTFTYGGTVNPDLILSGWDGSAVAVTVRIQRYSGTDVLTVNNPSDDSILLGLGAIDLSGNHANGTIDFTGSQMTLSGDTVTVVLGTLVGTAHLDTSPKAMTWWTSRGTATESGALDADF
jgi:chitinase